MTAKVKKKYLTNKITGYLAEGGLIPCKALRLYKAIIDGVGTRTVYKDLDENNYVIIKGAKYYFPRNNPLNKMPITRFFYKKKKKRRFPSKKGKRYIDNGRIIRGLIFHTETTANVQTLAYVVLDEYGPKIVREDENEVRYVILDRKRQHFKKEHQVYHYQLYTSLQKLIQSITKNKDERRRK